MLYHAESLTGHWQPHSANPLISADNSCARPAGRVVAYDNHIIRFAQDCRHCYGKEVRAFVLNIINLTDVKEYEHSASPVLIPGGAEWNRSRMHHIDPHQLSKGRWLACVDGDWRTS